MYAQQILSIARHQSIPTELYSGSTRQWLLIGCKQVWAVNLKGEVDRVLEKKGEDGWQARTVEQLLEEVKKGLPMMRASLPREQKVATEVDLGPATVEEFLSSDK